MSDEGRQAVSFVRDPASPAVLTLILNRPARLNAYDRSMRDALFEGLGLADADPTIAVVIVRGAGRAFSSGGDLEEFGTAPSAVEAREIRLMRDVWNRLASLDAWTIASIHGLAFGGGLEMALLCDLVLCASDARLALPETGLGALPGVGGTQTLPRRVGEGRASAMLLAGREMDGREAARIGAVSGSVSPARLEGETRRWASKLAVLDPRLSAALRGCLRRGVDLPLGEALRLEKRAAKRIGMEPK